MPIIPATQEAEAGESLESKRQRLRSAEIAPLHSSLGNKSKTPSQKKRERERNRINTTPETMTNKGYLELKLNICFTIHLCAPWRKRLELELDSSSIQGRTVQKSGVMQ